MPRIRRITVRHLRMPLVQPYRLSYRTFDQFEPYLVEIDDDAGNRGFGDAHISPGSSSETREAGWQFLIDRCAESLGAESDDAKRAVLARFSQSKAATTAFVSAIEVLQHNKLLDVPEEVRLPLLVPVNATDPTAVGSEVEALVLQGFGTLKVKVGKDIEADLKRVAAIQEAAAGRATLRLDANRAFSREQGINFASRLKPHGIDLFEQPCDADDWEANGAVALASRVPLMLDEPICTLADIERASHMANVGFCKLKLKRFGGLDQLKQGLDAVRAHGMIPVLGDGLGSEVQSWLEACVARKTIDNAGEFNGFLKARDRLLSPPLPYAAGAITLPAHFSPEPDSATVERFTVERRVFEH